MIVPEEVMQRLVEKFVKDLNDYAGCYVNAPIPMLHVKGQLQTITLSDSMKENICNRTAEMLTMMGVKFERLKNSLKLTELPREKQENPAKNL